MSNLKITGYSDEQFTKEAPEPNLYEAMLNPEGIERGAEISYKKRANDAGAHDSAPQFDDIPSQSLGFDLVIDCTGIVDAKRTDLKAELDKLYSVLYDYKSETHRSNYVKVVWGSTLQFKGVMTKMDVSYTFFKPDGTALRARIKLQFRSYVDPRTNAKKKSSLSPDLTHRVLVREGDSLPMIAQDVYRSPDYFVALAKANRLNKFRNLEAGTTILTPPLKSAGALHG